MSWGRNVSGAKFPGANCWGRNVTEAKQPGCEMSPGRKTGGETSGSRSPRCSRRRQIIKANISTHIIVNKPAANCLEEVVRPFTPMLRGFDGHPLTSPSVVLCKFFKLFCSRHYNVSKNASWSNCSAAHELLLRHRKILFLEEG